MQECHECPHDVAMHGNEQAICAYRTTDRTHTRGYGTVGLTGLLPF